MLAVGLGAVLVAAALGLAAAYALTSKLPEAPEKSEQQAAPEMLSKREYVPFGTSVVNLAGGRLTRYLQVSIVLKVDKASAPAVQKQVQNGRKAVFKNWLITYLSDKRLEEVEGAAAIRRVQREVQDGFNAILAESGDTRVEAVLFEEFNIQ
jgi:flagellar basal body-associated protein FliL